MQQKDWEQMRVVVFKWLLPRVGLEFNGLLCHERQIMKVLSSNKDLYEYLLFLTSVLKQRGAIALGEAIELAIGNAASFSTEFLGESRIALKRVRDEEDGILTDEERIDLLDVLKQLDKTFNKP